MTCDYRVILDFAAENSSSSPSIPVGDEGGIVAGLTGGDMSNSPSPTLEPILTTGRSEDKAEASARVA